MAVGAEKAMPRTPTAEELRSAMGTLAKAYTDPDLQRQLDTARRARGDVIRLMREALLPVQAPVLERLGLPAGEQGLASMQNAVNRRVCEGDAKLRDLANECLRSLGLAPMRSNAGEVTAEDFFVQMESRYTGGQGAGLDLETLPLDPSTASLLAALRKKRQPHGGITLGVLTVWQVWEKVGLPPQVQERPREQVSVPRLERPSPEQLLEHVLLNRPVVISGAISEKEFPPLHNFADFDYLRRRCGGKPVKVKGDLVEDRDGRKVFVTDPTVQMPFAEYLDMVEEAERSQRAPAFYMGKVPLSEELPELVEDIEKAPASPITKYGECFGPNPKGIHTYFGCSRNTTAMHFDPSENLLLVVSGSKTFELYHPSDVDCLYPTKPPGYTNSVVPPFVPPGSMPSDLQARCPHYRHAQPVRVELSAGDMLYLPLCWWHGVIGGSERNMILNWWCEMHPRKKAVGDEARGARGALAALKKSDAYRNLQHGLPMM
uniref:JmjC domain-containing protein n=1 Tax=Alexandrium catenella TaxID=2925 RepID=A0A7S1RHI4_ALECA|mmetsp:Transcript_58566/g.156779  ORF Transcript_58566/g.156779 Transcript_58566/m.156779 type:complete len:489 (+) Transcript_58566:84-1550(+)